jgi:hypothetical protein
VRRVVLDGPGIAALEQYLTKGGNLIGVHSAATTLSGSTVFTREIGKHHLFILSRILSISSQVPHSLIILISRKQ